MSRTYATACVSLHANVCVRPTHASTRPLYCIIERSPFDMIILNGAASPEIHDVIFVIAAIKEDGGRIEEERRKQHHDDL